MSQNVVVPDKIISASPFEKVRQFGNILLALYQVPEGERFNLSRLEQLPDVRRNRELREQLRTLIRLARQAARTATINRHLLDPAPAAPQYGPHGTVPAGRPDASLVDRRG